MHNITSFEQTIFSKLDLQIGGTQCLGRILNWAKKDQGNLLPKEAM